MKVVRKVLGGLIGTGARVAIRGTVGSLLAKGLQRQLKDNDTFKDIENNLKDFANNNPWRAIGLGAAATVFPMMSLGAVGVGAAGLGVVTVNRLLSKGGSMNYGARKAAAQEVWEELKGKFKSLTGSNPKPSP